MAPEDALVSGTASIVGEETCHAGDLAAQLQELSLNLAALVAAMHEDGASWRIGCATDADIRRALTRYDALRAYVPNAEHDEAVIEWVRETLPQLDEIEIVRADLCRPDLLVEVEGTLSCER